MITSNTLKLNSKWIVVYSLLAVFLTGGDLIAQGDPVKLIESKNIELQKLLKEKASSQTKAKKEKIKKLINDIFDFEELGRKSLGSKTYATFSDQQKVRFTQAFKTMVENSSMKRLEVYQSDSTQYEKPDFKKKNQKANVTAHTFYKGRESILVYKLFVLEGKWRAWDLVIDDLSTRRQYKERFSKVLKKKSIDELIAMLEKKAQEGTSNPK